MDAPRCIVVGGSGTVGRALCAALAERGARVGFTFFEGEDVADVLLRDHASLSAARLDLTDRAAVGPTLARLAEGLGGVDAFVHAAVRTSTLDPPRFDSLDDIDLEGFRRLMDVNVTSALLGARALAPLFPEAGGNIVLMGSVDGVKPVPSPVAYAASKGALRAMALSLSKALAPRRIRVNCVAPGILEEGASRTIPQELKDDYLAHCGLRRFGRVSETVAMVQWMAIDNRYVNGQTMLVDGGL